MKKLIFIISLFLAVACNGQIPSIGAFQIPGILPSSDSGVLPECEIGTSSLVHSFSYAGQDGRMIEVHFSNDGLTMFLLGETKYVYQYSLTTPWIVSTASYTNKSFDVSPYDNGPSFLNFNSDGTIMYFGGYYSDKCHQFNLSTPWDLSSVSFIASSPSLSSEATVPYAGAFSDDGTKFYIRSYGPLPRPSIVQYNLSTAWDITTISYTTYFYIDQYDIYMNDFEFSSDGTICFVSMGSTKVIITLHLSIPFDFTGSVSYGSDLFYPRNGDVGKIPYGFNFSGNYNYWYMISVNSSNYPKSVVQYELCN